MKSKPIGNIDSEIKVAWLPGDGIGNDVMDSLSLILSSMKLDINYVPGDIGWEFWCKEGNPLPDRTIELLKKTNAAMFGAITSKPKKEAEIELTPELQGKGLVYLSPIVKLRQMFDLYVNIRPCKAFPKNPLNYKDGIDLVIFRENTEGLYSGVEFNPVPEKLMNILLEEHPKMKKFENETLEDVSISLRIFTKECCRRLVKSAFEYAKKHNKKSVTLVEKPNVIRETSGMITREARDVAKDYPKIELLETNIDAMVMWLVKNPEDYGVIATSNMFGDIVSDLAAQLIGGLGFAYSGNIGDNYAIFEPTHGSAPKYSGQYRVNPIATFLAGKLMLEYLGFKKEGEAIEKAVGDVIKEGKVRTYDMVKGIKKQDKENIILKEATSIDMAIAVIYKMGLIENLKETKELDKYDGYIRVAKSLIE